MDTSVSASDLFAAYLRLRRREVMALSGLLESIEPDDDSPFPPTVEGIRDAAWAYQSAVRDRRAFEVPDDVDLIDLLAFTNRWIVDVNMCYVDTSELDWEDRREARNGIAASLGEAVWANCGPIEVWDLDGSESA